MPHDPARLSDTAAWLRKAEEDLEIATKLDFSKSVSGGIVFHCQQAAEKSLKAYLVWHDVPFRKTHYLKDLADACLELDATLRDVLSRAVPLTEYAWKFRYPGEAGNPGREESESALSLAREVYDAIRARLPQEARP